VTTRKEDEVGKVVVSQFMTLDGVFEDPGGSEGTERGAWAFQFDRGEDGDRFKLNEVMASDALLLGRVTWEGFAAAWPTREGEFADKFNGMQKYVVSSTLREPEWSNSRVVSLDEIPALREAEGGDILVNGSGQLVAALFERDLVDELRLMVFPTVLGAGRRLFGDTRDPKPLQLVESRPVGPDGVTVLIYKPVTREE
jgi:dihydrofolate reductase